MQIAVSNFWHARMVRSVIGLSVLLMIAGCSQSTTKPLVTGSLSKQANIAASPVVKVPESSKSFHPEPVAGRLAVANAGAEPNARCRRILAAAGVKTSFLRSPTVTAELDDDESVDVGVGYDLIDLKRANLTESLALAQCNRLAAVHQLSYLIVTSTSAVSYFGKLASAAHISDSHGEMASIADEISYLVNRGRLTVQQAAGLNTHLTRLRSRQAQDLAEAQQRQVAEKVFDRDFRNLDSLILNAEERIHQLQRTMRTADAFSTRLSANYGRSSLTDDQFEEPEDDVSAKIEVSVRLGALSRKRRDYEDILSEARQAEYYEIESGAFWRAKELAEANRKAIVTLERQKRSVEQAIAFVSKTFSRKAAIIHPARIPDELRARIELIGLRADLAAVEGTLTYTRSLNRKLSLR